jgi:uncharacterized protein with GYD domain
MTSYIMLAKWTDQGIRNVRESPARVDKTRKLLQEMGGDFRQFFLTMGEYDMVAIYEAPDDAVAARFSLELGALGYIRTETLKAFPEAAYREIVRTLA